MRKGRHSRASEPCFFIYFCTVMFLYWPLDISSMVEISHGKLDEDTRRILEKQGYKIVGNHSAVKLCHWLRERLLRRRICYKQAFYGIDTHRCLQMTPALTNCTHACLFCWRYQGFNRADIPLNDDPVEILDGAIEAQRKLVVGYKGDPRVDKEMWAQAMEPNQIAISLTGEPTLYTRLGEFLEEAHKRGMTTFLVTNGTMPEVLENLDPLPTQLYVSLTATNEEMYKKLNVPLMKKGWERLMRTLEILPSLDTRRVIRHTLVKGWNMDVEGYAKLDAISEPHFIEPKAFVLVGNARQHFTLDNMPSHDEIRAFAKQLEDLLPDYRIVGEQRASRVVLLSNGKVPRKIKDPEPFPVAPDTPELPDEEEMINNEFGD